MGTGGVSDLMRGRVKDSRPWASPLRSPSLGARFLERDQIVGLRAGGFAGCEDLHFTLGSPFMQR